MTAQISVIIPVYNTATYLPACLDSLLSQTFNDIEIICVNDASTDDSLKILKKYAKKDNRIKIISYTKNKGQGHARNVALKTVRTPFIGFIDSDDTIDTDYYEVLYQKIKNADIASNRMELMDDNGECSPVIWPIANYTLQNVFTTTSERLGLLYCNGNVSTVKHLFRTDLIQNNNITFETGIYFEDQLFMLQALYYAKCVINDEIMSPVYHYYIRTGSSSHKKHADTKYKKSKFDQFTICQKMLNFLESKKIESIHKVLIEQGFFYIFCWEIPALHKNYLIPYLNACLNALRNSPFYWRMWRMKIIYLFKIEKKIKRVQKHACILWGLLGGKMW